MGLPGALTRDLPPWQWRADPDRSMAGQPAADGAPVGDSAAEKRRFREHRALPGERR